MAWLMPALLALLLAPLGWLISSTRPWRPASKDVLLKLSAFGMG